MTQPIPPEISLDNLGAVVNPVQGPAPASGLFVVSGPHPLIPTVRRCDVGGELIGENKSWWLVTATGHGWKASHGAACSPHAGRDEPARKATPPRARGHYNEALERIAEREADGGGPR
ncbi:hypothetical protein BDK92_7090 [Micromonospora pisi]|uniref:Uncharacterized protein n=1 Tax=Micromonospora pisi TaxID=589240 RepID=A0A495JVP1_9ACTN|nr:hypothetical protein [Micromonospora pisi]RKR92648.1 hypothetical protein BDK92_7090 [Micromonospora pisi]